MVRNCRQDTELVGEPVEEGTKVLMCIGSGNHDASKFEDPDTFRLDRASCGAPVVRIRPPHLSRCDAGPARSTDPDAGVHEADRVLFRIVDEHYDSLPLGMLQGQKSLRIVVEPA